jgi:leucyl/phenylalanyl-tRNA--protein transferase
MPVYRLTEDLVFPAPDLAREDGLLAVGGDLSVDRLLLAYSAGIFPWYSEPDPILWWSPDPRLVLCMEDFRVPRRLERTCRNTRLQITLDRSFQQVIEACARVRIDDGEGTWITGDMIDAYARLHDAGYAHSVEVWSEQRLVGGLYGVGLGGGFFGESMFSLDRDASKIALVHLARFLAGNGFDVIDCQVTTEHMSQFGAREITRQEFLGILSRTLRKPTLTGNWELMAPDDMRMGT